MRDLVTIQIDISCPVIKQDKIIPSAIHFRKAQHDIRVTYPRAEAKLAGDAALRRRDSAARFSDLVIARSYFDDYLCAGEQALCVHHHVMYSSCAAIVARWRLQRRGFGAGEQNADRRSLLCFSFCKDSPAIIG